MAFHMPRGGIPEGFGITSGRRLDDCLRSPWLWNEGRAHVCALDGEAVRQAERLEAGGVVCCDCGRPLLIPPASCVEYLADDLHVTFHASDLRPS
jgi:hypothetical protein